MKKSDRNILIAVGVLVVLVLAAVLAMGLAGFFSSSTSKNRTDILIAALSLTGVLVTAAVSFVGLLLKQSIDARTVALQSQAQKRLDEDSKHNQAMQEDAEKRLKLDTAIRAVQLLGTESGRPSSPLERAGALFTLASLGQHDLTNGLTRYLLTEGKVGDIDATTASGVLQSALTSGDPWAQMEAVCIVSDFLGSFLTENGAAIPTCLVEGCNNKKCLATEDGPGRCPGLPEDARYWVALILGDSLVSRSIDYWKDEKSRYNGYWIMRGLLRYYENEEKPDWKTTGGAILDRAWRAFPEFQDTRHAEFPEIRDLNTPDVAGTRVVRRLEEWARDEPSEAASPDGIASGRAPSGVD